MARWMMVLLLFSHSVVAGQPATIRHRVVDNYHGNLVVDPYQWLESEKDPAVIDWTEEQHVYTRGHLSMHRAVPFLEKNLNSLFSSAYEKTIDIGEERFLIIDKAVTDLHPVLYLQDGLAGEIIELVNPNNWPYGDRLDSYRVSPDARYLAYLRSRGGDEAPSLHVIDLDTRGESPQNTYGWRHKYIAWHPTLPVLYYTAYPAPEEVGESQSYFWEGVFAHNVETNETTSVFWEPTDEGWFHWIGVDEGSLIIARSAFGRGSETYEMDMTDVVGPAVLIEIDDGKTFVRECQIGEWIYSIRGVDSSCRKVFRKEEGKWRVFIPESELLMVDIKGVGGRLYLHTIDQGASRIQIYSEEGLYLRDLPLPGVGVAEVYGEWEKDKVTLWFENLTTPATTFFYDDATNQLERDHCSLKRFDSEAYETTRHLVRSKDGTLVPMFVAHPRGLMLDGSHPTILTGYGGFGVDIFPSFSAIHTPWLESGGILAQPLLRGGGELGEWWHQEGMKEKKQNVFDDFLASARFLIDAKYTTPQRLAISGASNGGLLVGAALVQAPHLFGAVVCEVPLLDMLRFHKFKIAHVWTHEYGCSENVEDFLYLRDYSPYHNVRSGIAYPATFLRAGANDVRVDALHVRKMAARLQHAQQGSAPIVMEVSPHCGHGWSPGRQGIAGDQAKRLGFIAHHLGMESRFPAIEPELPRSGPGDQKFQKIAKILQRRGDLTHFQDEVERQTRFHKIQEKRRQNWSESP